LQSTAQGNYQAQGQQGQQMMQHAMQLFNGVFQVQAGTTVNFGGMQISFGAGSTMNINGMNFQGV
jgi:hypothetical protein